MDEDDIDPVRLIALQSATYRINALSQRYELKPHIYDVKNTDIYKTGKAGNKIKFSKLLTLINVS